MKPYGSLNDRSGRFCECGYPISRRATTCRWCRVYPRTPLEDRFWPRVDKTGECWVWTGATGAGYGRVRRGSQAEPMPGAHVVSWELVNGPVPDGLIVCHRCDNPPCVRPDHLFLGTYTDNMQDALAKGRMATGERWHAARSVA